MCEGGVSSLRGRPDLGSLQDAESLYEAEFDCQGFVNPAIRGDDRDLLAHRFRSNLSSCFKSFSMSAGIGAVRTSWEKARSFSASSCNDASVSSLEIGGRSRTMSLEDVMTLPWHSAIAEMRLRQFIDTSRGRQRLVRAQTKVFGCLWGKS